MVKEYSPFTPGVPVPLEFFVGRTREIEKFISSVKKSVELKTLERLFVMGERGIGKSSLCNLGLKVAEEQLGVLGLHVFLGGVNTLEEMVRRIFERLLQESRDKAWFDAVKRFLGNHVEQVGLFGITVKFAAKDRDLSQAVSDFVPAVRNLLKQLEPHKKGLLLILDDLNGLAALDRFAHWIKSTVDEVATGRDPVPMTIVLVGLPERRQQVIDRQPSLDRVFDLVSIERFSRKETAEFFDKAFGRVNVSVSSEAQDVLCQFSGGFPVFMHEIGDSVFAVDEDNHIDEQDALKGVIRAAHVIGAKYLEPKVLAAIRSERYQVILRKIAQEPFEHRFTRKDAVARLSAEEVKVFDNFLRRMENLGVIRKDRERGPGGYEFTSEIYYLFFWLQATANR